jgi:TolA-binding protein
MLVTLLAGCSDDPEALLDTAQLEEKQNNPDHARELYERIVRDDPETLAATIAHERLKALDAAP